MLISHWVVTRCALHFNRIYSNPIFEQYVKHNVSDFVKTKLFPPLTITNHFRLNCQAQFSVIFLDIIAHVVICRRLKVWSQQTQDVDAGPSSRTLGPYQPNIGSTSRVCWDMTPQQARHIATMLGKCWPTVCDASPPLKQHRLRRWPNIKPTLF